MSSNWKKIGRGFFAPAKTTPDISDVDSVRDLGERHAVDALRGVVELPLERAHAPFEQADDVELLAHQTSSLRTSNKKADGENSALANRSILDDKSGCEWKPSPAKQS